MRVVLSGTHASGKSTLLADFCAARPEFTWLPDPFEMLADHRDAADASSFLAQLAVTGRELEELEPGTAVVAERCPLDFLAYLEAGETLGRGVLPREVLEGAYALAAPAMTHVDLLVLLPLNPADLIRVQPEEDIELRAAMNDALLDLSDDPDLVGPDTRVVEITGDRERRLRMLQAAVDAKIPRL